MKQTYEQDQLYVDAIFLGSEVGLERAGKGEVLPVAISRFCRTQVLVSSDGGDPAKHTGHEWREDTTFRAGRSREKAAKIER